MTYTLYGSQASYFTGKVRGYLRWKGVTFEEVASTPEVMKTIILPAVGWPVVPVMETARGDIIQDTADIIAYVETAEGGTPVMPAGPVQRLVSYLLQLFADEWLTLPAMHYRWNYNEEWIYGEFGRGTAPDAPPERQYEIGKQIGQRFRGFVPMLGITEQTIPGIESSYEAFLADFEAHLAHHSFLLGGRPTLGDFALIGPLYAHLLRDPASGEIMQRLAPRVAAWTARVHDGEAGEGDVMAGDAIPEMLEPILARHLREHLPVLAQTAAQFGDWARTAAPGAEVPRGVGLSDFSVEGRDGQIASRTFSLFRLQDALDTLAEMAPADRARADAFLARIGAEALSSFTLPARLARRNYRLHLA